MHRLFLDVRLAVRRLRRTPSFATLVVALLAIGIGGAAAVFSVLNVIYYRPMPYPHGDRLAVLSVSRVAANCGRRCTRDPNPAEVRAWAQESSAIETVGSISPMQAVAQGDVGANVVEGAAVTEGILDILAPQAALGRSLTHGDFASGADPALVLSHSGWRDLFSGDSSVVGRRLLLSGTGYTIVGVLSPVSELGPPLFSLNVPSAQFWVARDPTQRGRSSVNRTIARLRPDADLAGLRQQLDVILQRNAGMTWTAKVQSLRDAVSARYRGSFWYLLGAVALLLGVACLNVGALFLARLNERAPELATRVALGGSQWDIVRYVLVEAALIVSAGGICGAVLAYYGALAARLLPAGRLPSWEAVSLDWRVLVVSLALAIISTIAVVAAPIVVFEPRRLLTLLREHASVSKARSRAQAAFVSAQVALSLILLTSALALARILVTAELRDIGMSKHSLFYVQLRRPAEASKSSSTLTFRLLDELRRTRGVLDVAAEGVQPNYDPRSTRENGVDATMVAEGAISPFTDAVAPRSAMDVTPDYFATMGIAIKHGRVFGSSDGPGAQPVAILDEPTARRMFPNGSALGRRVKFGDATSDEPWLLIVGVAAAVQDDPLETPARYRPRLYRSMRQFPTFPTSLIVKVDRRSPWLAPPLRRAIGRADASVAVASIISVEDSLGARLWDARFNALVITVFALVAVLLACFGVYAAIAYLVSTRKRELAIRIALGATHHEIVSTVVRSGMMMLVPGFAFGLSGSVFVNRVMRSILYGAPTFEPAVLAIVLAAISAASFVATWLPARRAAGIQPGVVLRST